MDENGVLWFDDEPVRDVKRLRRKCRRGTIWYATRSVTPSVWTSLLEYGDSAFGPAPGEISGVDLRTEDGGRIRILDTRCWDITDADPNVCASWIELLAAQAKSCDLPFKHSAAATAMAVYMSGFDGIDGRPEIRQLPPRWRTLAHACMQAGPVSVLRAESKAAVHLDVRKAYLKAMMDPLPVYGRINGETVGGWFTHDDLKWSSIRHLVGFVEATVSVHSAIGLDLPPLPIDTATGSVYPVGVLRGAWTIGQLADAEERGEAEIRKVHQFCYAPVVEPIFHDLALLFASLPDPLNKTLYTRFWGKLGSSGGFAGYKSKGNRVVYGARPGLGFWWVKTGINRWSSRSRPTYRPDLAAMIIAHNQRHVMSAVRELELGSVLATHVDAIWTTDFEGAKKLSSRGETIGTWSWKKDGPIRFYGHGVYQHGDRLVCSGFDQHRHGPLTPEVLASFSTMDGLDSATERSRRHLLVSRRWDKDPAKHADATSQPVFLDMGDRPTTLEFSVYDPCWLRGGWHVDQDLLEISSKAEAQRIKSELADMVDMMNDNSTPDVVVGAARDARSL